MADLAAQVQGLPEWEGEGLTRGQIRDELGCSGDQLKALFNPSGLWLSYATSGTGPKARYHSRRDEAATGKATTGASSKGSKTKDPNPQLDLTPTLDPARVAAYLAWYVALDDAGVESPSELEADSEVKLPAFKADPEAHDHCLAVEHLEQVAGNRQLITASGYRFYQQQRRQELAA